MHSNTHLIDELKAISSPSSVHLGTGWFATVSPTLTAWDYPGVQGVCHSSFLSCSTSTAPVPPFTNYFTLPVPLPALPSRQYQALSQPVLTAPLQPPALSHSSSPPALNPAPYPTAPDLDPTPPALNLRPPPLLQTRTLPPLPQTCALPHCSRSRPSPPAPDLDPPPLPQPCALPPCSRSRPYPPAPGLDPTPLPKTLRPIPLLQAETLPHPCVLNHTPYLDVLLEVALEAAVEDLALAGLQPIHHTRDGALQVRTGEQDELLRDRGGEGQSGGCGGPGGSTAAKAVVGHWTDGRIRSTAGDRRWRR